MKILVGHEKSQRVTIELRKLGHEAFSCDLLECDGGHPEWHLQCDVFEAIDMGVSWTGGENSWDAGLFFPDCTYLTYSAEWAYKEVPYHQKVGDDILLGEERKEARRLAVQHVKMLWGCGMARISIENPVGVLSTQFRKPTQIIHPYQFGDDASKRTCLWLRSLPKLVPTNIIEPRYVNGKPRWGNQAPCGAPKLAPSKDRSSIRGITYPGIARAMATQWFGT